MGSQKPATSGRHSSLIGQLATTRLAALGSASVGDHRRPSRRRSQHRRRESAAVAWVASVGPHVWTAETGGSRRPGPIQSVRLHGELLLASAQIRHINRHWVHGHVPSRWATYPPCPCGVSVSVSWARACVCVRDQQALTRAMKPSSNTSPTFISLRWLRWLAMMARAIPENKPEERRSWRQKRWHRSSSRWAVVEPSCLWRAGGVVMTACVTTTTAGIAGAEPHPVLGM
jgi:hypothetical protein